MRRVLLGRFNEITRRGLEELLRDEDVELLLEPADEPAIISRISELRPDVVILDLDDDGGPDLAERIAAEYPAIKVVACSSKQPLMRVFPAFRRGESYALELNRRRLTSAVMT